MMSTRTWKPWTAGAITLLAALLALTGWWLIAGDDSESGTEPPVAGPTSTFDGTTSDDESSGDESVEEDEVGDVEADRSETGADLPRDGMTAGTTGGDRTGSGSVDRDGDGNPDDISDLAGEGEDYGPADETDPGGTDDIVFYMPEMDWTDYADLFGGSDDPEIACPPGFRTPAGDCIDYGDQLERMGRVPVPGGGY